MFIYWHALPEWWRVVRGVGVAPAPGREMGLQVTNASSGDRNVIMSRVRSLASLAASVALPLGLGGLGAVATARALPEWYANLAKPSWNPPPQVFGPVWTVLYTAMGLAAWLVWRRGSEAQSSSERSVARGALTVYAAQLALNAIWSPVFFGLKRIDLALAVIVGMFVLIAETIRRFYRVRPASAALLAPYLAWVAFATVLNWGIWRLNSGGYALRVERDVSL